MKHTIKTYWLIIHQQDSILFTRTLSIPEEKDIASLKPHFLRQFTLKTTQDAIYHCAEISENTALEARFEALPLKQALSVLGAEQYHLGVRAHAIISWDKNHRFCGCCGCATQRGIEGEFERTCAKCHLSFFPRISPSVIVLIRKGGEILMARSPHFLPGAYGLIAGFVEPGESLEEAVHREVKEEVGITIQNLRYFGSQPWPFPDSLVIGFTADYQAGEIVIDTKEIEDAGWYRPDNLPGRPSSKFSIASTLLDQFFNKILQPNSTHLPR
jgi:NAD+ diphosphatase